MKKIVFHRFAFLLRWVIVNFSKMRNPQLQDLRFFATYGFTMPARKPFESNSFTLFPKGESNGWTGGGADTRKR
ncbi:MAG: hypothetical protein ACI4YB_09260 [Oscillospiraceae bacterium]